MKIRKILTLLLLAICLAGSAQDSIKGRVIDAESASINPLPGAFIQWLDHPGGTFADKDGYFAIPLNDSTNQLIVGFVTYISDTITVSNKDSFYLVRLMPEGIGEVTIFARFMNYGLSGVEPRTTINLSEREFQKAACCNLSESFQNAPAIDVSFADAITGTRQIKMLGLDGFYTLISREYMPTVRTLNSYYGMSFIPSSWVKSIQITKGAGSIVNGYESIAGQINIEMRKPFDGEKFLLDQFISESGRSETDLMYQWNVGQHMAGSLFAKLALYTTIQDRNGDGFIDNPFGQQIALMNRWQFYTDGNLEGQFNMSYNRDTKNSGQTSYLNEQSPDAYGIEIDNEQFDVWSKIGKVFPDKPYQSLGSQFRFNHTNLKGKYGPDDSSRKLYTASSNNFYMNLMYESIIRNSFHKIKTGISMLADEMDEMYASMQFNRLEIVPGIFTEYTYQPKEQLSFVLGARVDYNSIYRWSFTPRFHSKWRFNDDKTSIRGSAGLGRRTSNILAQNQQFFISNRDLNIVVSDSNGAYGLEQELAINAGLSLEHQFKLYYFPATFYLDYFYTEFLNEVVFDREREAEVWFYNVKNGTKAHSFQAQVDLQPFRRTEIRLAYRMFDVKSVFNTGTVNMNPSLQTSKPFIAKNRMFLNISQGTRKGWSFSSTLQWYGPQRIPGISGIEDPQNNELVSSYSPDFFLWNFQLSKNFEFPFEVYLGVENLLNYKQNNPIRMSEDFQDSAFDAGLVWGPVFGRMIYGGFRLRIKYQEHDHTDEHDE